MPYDFLLDHNRRWLTIIAGDPVTPTVMHEVLAQQAAQGSWTYRTLQDLRLVTWKPTTNEIRAMLDEMTRLLEKHGRRGPVAVVANDSLLFGMARMYASLGEIVSAHTARMFTDVEAAERWLRAQTTEPA